MCVRNQIQTAIFEAQATGEAFYLWADAMFYVDGEGWPDAHPWGICTDINEVARVLLERRGVRSRIIGLPEEMMPDWWRERYKTGHDWVRTECGADIDLWPLLYGEEGFAHPPLPAAAVQVYGFDEPGLARAAAEADLAEFSAWWTARESQREAEEADKEASRMFDRPERDDCAMTAAKEARLQRELD